MNRLLTATFLILLMAFSNTSCKKTKADDIKVYPNPATTYIVFDASASASKHKDGEIHVKNTAGATVKVFKTLDNPIIQWRIDSVDRGVYFYTYKAEKMKTQTGKIQFN